MSVRKLYVSDYLAEIFSRLPRKHSVGDKIKAIREFVGLTQGQLAIKMNWSRKTIVKYENNFDDFSRVVSGVVLQRFADALSVNNFVVTVSDLMNNVEQ